MRLRIIYLDAEALANCSLNTERRLSPYIDARLRQRAADLAWWMAVRTVISEARQNTLQDFPPHPTCAAVVDQTTAMDYIQGLPWWNAIQAYAPTLSLTNLQNRLAIHHATAASWVGNGTWSSEFPGKELFRHIRGWVYTNPPQAASASLQDADLAKAVGEWQAANDRVPQELRDLLTAMKSRVGIP